MAIVISRYLPDLGGQFGPRVRMGIRIGGITVFAWLAASLGGTIGTSILLVSGIVVAAMIFGRRPKPKAAAEERAAGPIPDSGDAACLGARILVVEDNVVNQKITSAMLASQGYHFDIAENGEAALDLIAQRPYGLVLMDIQMPMMDGFEATKRIRALEGPQGKVPIVAVTANAMRGDKASYLEAGMNDFVPKPVDAMGLLTLVDTFLKDTPKEAGSEKPEPPSKMGAA